MPDQEIEQTGNEGRPIRLLIQQVQSGSRQSWRLIAYGDGDRHCAPEFESLEALLVQLRRLLPDLDLSGIAAPSEGSGPSIIYATDVRLTDEQRTGLGLISGTSGRAGRSPSKDIPRGPA